MRVSQSYQDFVLEQLDYVVPAVRAKSMFGGVGIYSEDLFFALIADDTLYFKVDDSSRSDYEVLKMRQFANAHYFEVPIEVLEDLEELQRWANKAIAVAANPQSKRREAV